MHSHASDERRVVITGLGAVTAMGLGRKPFWDALCAGRSAIGPLRLEPFGELGINIAAQLPPYAPEDHFDAKQLLVMDRFAQFAVMAAREAVADAGIDFESELGATSAVILGTGVGGKSTDDEAAQLIYAKGGRRVNPMIIPRVMASAATSQVSAEFGITGPAFSTTSACASAGHAIAQAYMMIQSGLTPVVLSGGSEACLNYGTLRAWEAMRVMAPDNCRPFSRQRKGMVLGEGGAVLVLESLAHARRRGANIYAELAGVGMSADAGHITRPDETGAARSMNAALTSAGLAASDIDYINAHGTGTPVNDVTETKAIHLSFGDHAKHLAISSTKSMHGHTLGAAGAIELVATTLSLYHGIIPPTANYLEPDPACDLDYVPNQARERRLQAALSNSFAFGGLNVSLALSAAP